MLIRKINVVFMKHSRWLFGIFTVIIIVSFMEFLTPGKFSWGGFSDPSEAPAGTAFGQTVTVGELRDEMEDLVVGALFVNGTNVQSPSPEDAFFSLCARKAADQRGLVVTDQEISDFIAGIPAFSVKGAFSYEKYQERLALMRKRGISEDRVTGALRHALLLQKLMQEMSAVTVTANEVENFYRMLHETYEVKIADFPRDVFVKELKIEAAALKDYFSANSGNYTIPVQLTAQVAVFRFDQPEVLKRAAQVTDDEIRRFYDRNQQSFAGKDGKIPAFDAVRAEAKTHCIAERVREIVGDEAQDFARAAYDLIADRTDRDAAFAELAAGRKIKLTDPVKFGVDAEAVGDIREPELIKALNAVYVSAPVSNAVVGKSAAYVGLVTAREEARDAKFNEVARQVQDDFIREESSRLAKEAAGKFRDALESEAAAKRAADKRFSRQVRFSLSDMNLRLDDRMVAQQVLMLKPGELTPVTATPEGAAVGCLVRRTAPDMAEFAKTKDMWEMNWKNFKWQSQFESFQRYIQANCALQKDLAE
jgi:hypothetical protein